jgi:HemY protein
MAKANQLIAVARKQSALPAEVLDSIADQAYSSTLSEASDKELAWKALPRTQQKRIDNILLYVSHLVDSGENGAAEKLIRTTLKNQWSDNLIGLYGALDTNKPAKLLRTVEGWLLARPESAELNLAAGQFCMQDKRLEKAKEYLQQAIELGQLPAAYSLLGDVYEASNDGGKALRLYRSGMNNLASLSQLKKAIDAAEGELIPIDRS